ncbi:uncharacterized protein BDR25DRAFT_310880 [Lindgomyces ingoldianus]|uniref:Uncharacterized protein n=1 Tax=Lindgomyces ingoldianus TaxID=673940 RepID=A0ACB6R9T8_9PLEO|nr:uncharacterized protein BDR25DRAFT_310880 [Lindgomyces ingoldianus]KAF2475523.1 hypothetical protein BDR25DRAFT_310880 [Lindgomyces ingoldianus]
MAQETPSLSQHPPSQTIPESASPSLLTAPEPIHYEEPLYTEIRIPLPPIPQRPSSTPASKSRHRAHTLSSLSPFHRRRPSSPEKAGPGSCESPAAAMMKSLTVGRKRSGTVDALAVVPAVLVLSAELFTPGQEGGKKGVGRDGVVT